MKQDKINKWKPSCLFVHLTEKGVHFIQFHTCSSSQLSNPPTLFAISITWVSVIFPQVACWLWKPHYLYLLYEPMKSYFIQDSWGSCNSDQVAKYFNAVQVSVCLFLNWFSLQDVNQKTTCVRPDWENKLQVHWPITLLKLYSLCHHHVYIVVYYCILLHRCNFPYCLLSSYPPNPPSPHRLCNYSTSGCRLFNHAMLRGAGWCFGCQRNAAPIMKSQQPEISIGWEEFATYLRHHVTSYPLFVHR